MIKEGTLYAYSHSSLIENVVIDNDDDDDDEDGSGQHECTVSCLQHWVTEHAYMSVQVKAGSPEHKDTLLQAKVVNILILIILIIIIME